MGKAGGAFIAVGVIISSFAALNGSILSGSRVPYAQARDGLFPQFLAGVHPRFRTPAAAIAAQSVIAVLLALTGQYVGLYTKVIFSEYLFYALVTAGIFILRRRMPGTRASLPHLGVPNHPGDFCYSFSRGGDEHLASPMVGRSLGAGAGGQRHSRVLSLEDMETFKMIDVIPSRARNLALFFLPLTLCPGPRKRRASFLAALGMTTDGPRRTAPKGGAMPLWLVMALLVLASASLAAQKPGVSAKPGARPGAALIKARWQVLGARPLAMYYYSPDPRGIESLEEHVSQMTLVAPQSFWVDAEGFVHGEVPPAILETARQAKVAVMPLVVNPGFDRRVASGLLRSVRAQQRAVTYLAYLARRDNFAGWQLDLEYIDPVDKSYYTRFVQRVAARLHRDGRLLSIAVVPRFSDAYPNVDPSRNSTAASGAPLTISALSARWLTS